MGKLMDRIERLLTGATAQERVALHMALADQRAAARLAALADDLEAHFEEDVRAERTMANLASLRDVPAHVLPDGPARTALVWLISAGHEAYCYASGGTLTGTRVVWLQPLADVRAGKDGRVTLDVWRVHYEELLTEMGLSLPAIEAQTAAEGRVSA